MTLKTNQTSTSSTKKQSTSQQFNQLNARALYSQKLSDVSYRHLTKLVNYVENAETPENAQRGRANFQAAYKNLTSNQKQQFTQRYEKETGQPSLVMVMNMMLTGKPQQTQPLRLKPRNPLQAAMQQSQTQPPVQAAPHATPVIGPSLPQKKVDPKTPGWLTDSKDFVKWADTVFVTGQGNLIEGFRQAEGGIAAASLAKTGKFFETTGAGFTIAAEVLDIYEVSNTAFQTNAKPQKLRQAIICLTVKTEAVTIAGAIGGAAGMATGPAAPVAAPGGAIILSVAADKLADFWINKIEWCKL